MEERKKERKKEIERGRRGKVNNHRKTAVLTQVFSDEHLVGKKKGT